MTKTTMYSTNYTRCGMVLVKTPSSTMIVETKKTEGKGGVYALIDGEKGNVGIKADTPFLYDALVEYFNVDDVITLSKKEFESEGGDLLKDYLAKRKAAKLKAKEKNDSDKTFDISQPFVEDKKEWKFTLKGHLD